MRRVHGPRPKSRSLMLATPEQMYQCARRYTRLGYRYVIGWKDVQGYGLMVLQFAEWQTPDSYPYVNLRER